MNHIFKTISKKIKGRANTTIVVSENASSLTKTTDNRSSLDENQTHSDFYTTLKQVLSVSLASILFVSSLQADIIADTNAPTNTQPIILNTQSGATQVNIQTPTSSGISVNNYSQFDTGTNGTILNNSRTNVNTVTAGWVEGNPFLATGSATAIVNQVNSSNPSNLTGNIEIAGSKADLIIANPSGISIDGATIINAGTSTLTTGTPIINGGDLSGFSVNDGTISVQGAGLNALGSDYTNILARSTAINAGIWANELSIVTGVNTISRDSSNITANTGVTTAPLFAIDSSALGGMYANKINLIGTEVGVGVNNAGVVGANDNISIDINGKLTNSGTITSKGDISVTTTSDIVNSNSISASKEVKLQSINIDNTDGEITAGRLDISADNLNNTNGSITQAGIQDLTITATNINNDNDGLIGYEPIDSSGDVDTNSTTGGGSTGGSTGGGSTGGSTGGGSTTPTITLATGNINITNTLLNDNGKLVANGATTLNTTGTLTNSSTIDVENLNASGSSLNNDSGTINANNINISTTDIINTNKIQSNSKTTINSSSMSGDGEIISNGDIDIDLSSNYINAMKINGFNIYVDVIGELSNNGEITSSNTTSLKATDSITNRGLIDGYITSLGATNSINNIGEGRIYGDWVSIKTDTLNNTKENDKSAAIGAREELNIGANIINNIDGATILSMGDMYIGGSLDENGFAIDKAKEINNLSATIESGGNMSLASDEINNINKHLITQQITDVTDYEEYVEPVSGSGTGQWFLVSDCKGIFGSQDDNYFGVSDEIAQRNQIIQDWKDSGSPYIGSGIFGYPAYRDNPEYQLLTSIINASSSEDYTLLKLYTTTSHTILTSSSPAEILSGEDMYIDGLLYNKDSHVIAGGTIETTSNPENIETKGQYITSYDGSTIRKTTVESDGWGGHDREWHGIASYDKADEKGELYSLGTTQFIENASTTDSSLEEKKDISLFATTTPNTSLPNSSLFATNPDNPNYFIQTDPRFTNYRNFISSDYMLSQLSLDPTTLHKRLGDGYYEQKLIREQVMALTGKRFLEGFNSDEEQYMALLNSGVEYMKSFDISAGVALSSEQMKNLTKDVVLLVEKEITLSDGTKSIALVPQLYVAASKVNTSGSLISANNIITNGSNDLVNSGTMMATNVVSLNSTSSINNNAGNISGNLVVLNAGKDININGGSVEANSAMALNATNNVNISSTIYSTTDTDGTSDFSKTGIQSTANIKVNNSDGELFVNAGKDINLKGANITNNGTLTQLTAGNDINLDTVQTSEQNNVIWDDKNHLKEGYTHEVGTTISTAGDNVILANNNINVKGSDIDSTYGLTGLGANHDINIEASTDTTNYDEAYYYKRSSWSGSKTTTVNETLDTTASQASNITGDSVILSSGSTEEIDGVSKITSMGSINIKGSNVVSSNDTVLNATNDINILSTTDTTDKTYFKEIIKSGLFSSGGFGITIGKSMNSNDNVDNSTTQYGSMVGSLQGDTTITAGNDYKQVGSSVISGHAGEDGNFVASGDVSITAKDIDIEAGYDTYNGDSITKTRQSGLTIAFTGGVVAAIESATSSVSDVGESKNSRVNAMATANAAYDVYQAAQAIQSLASDPNVGISITVGSSQSESKTHYEGESVVSSSVAGDNVTLKATGDKENSDINIVGSDVVGVTSTTLNSDHDINIIAASSTDEQHSKDKSSGWNVGVAVMVGAGGMSAGFTGGANVGKGKSDGESETYTNSHVGSLSGTTTITAGDTTNIIGGQVLGDKVTLNTTNLNIESLQDTATYDSKQMSASGQVTIGFGGANVSGSYSNSNIESDYASVGEQSGILAGGGGYNINVTDDTSLIGGIITSNQIAEDNGLNSFSTGTLVASNIDNFSRYEGDSFGISASASYSNPNASTNSEITNNTTDTYTTGAYNPDSSGVGKSIGYGSDSDSQTSTTYAGINTSNITITGNGNTDTPAEATGVQIDDNGMKTITAANLADIFTSTTTDQVEANSGSLKNTFDAEAVQNELDVQTRVTQTFDTNRQEVKAEINSKIDEANSILKADPNNKEAQQTIEDMQHLGVLVDSITGALYSPADSTLGTVANTLSPAIVYEIGQYFKTNEDLNKLDNGNRPEEGSAEHILAQTLVAAATASLAGNDALTAGLSAGGAEVIAPKLAEWLYGVDPNDPEAIQNMTSEQKNTISAIISLGSAAVGATTGETTDVISSSVAGTVAAEDNYFLQLAEGGAMIVGGIIVRKVVFDAGVKALGYTTVLMILADHPIDPDAAIEQAIYDMKSGKSVENVDNTATIVPEQTTSLSPMPNGDDDEDSKYSWPDNRVPKDKETILSNKTQYTDTGRIGPDNRKIYKGSDGNYYHMDNLHQGKGAEIEVYNKNGNHIGTANPKTGIIDRTNAVPGRNIKKYL